METNVGLVILVYLLYMVLYHHFLRNGQVIIIKRELQIGLQLRLQARCYHMGGKR